MLDPAVSEMSLGSQVSDKVRGLLMGPRRMEGEKHSLISEVSVGDFCQEYHKQASPALQYPCWVSSLGLNLSQSVLPLENKLPHWWQRTLLLELLAGAGVAGLDLAGVVGLGLDLEGVVGLGLGLAVVAICGLDVVG